MQVQSYLFFNGRCEEAIEFYKNTLGAKVEMLMRFKEAPGDHKCSPGSEEKVMHACLRIGETAVMASDGMAQGKSYAEALEEARRLGFAEADPSSDVDGHDSVYKLCILSSIAFSSRSCRGS